MVCGRRGSQIAALEGSFGTDAPTCITLFVLGDQGRRDGFRCVVVLPGEVDVSKQRVRRHAGLPAEALLHDLQRLVKVLCGSIGPRPQVKQRDQVGPFLFQDVQASVELVGDAPTLEEAQETGAFLTGESAHIVRG